MIASLIWLYFSARVIIAAFERGETIINLVDPVFNIPESGQRLVQNVHCGKQIIGAGLIQQRTQFHNRRHRVSPVSCGWLKTRRDAGHR